METTNILLDNYTLMLKSSKKNYKINEKTNQKEHLLFLF